MVDAATTACTATNAPPFMMSMTVGPLSPGSTCLTWSSAGRGTLAIT
jgi:hypothetical protein